MDPSHNGMGLEKTSGHKTLGVGEEDDLYITLFSFKNFLLCKIT